MKTKKRWISVALIATLCVGLLAGCGGGNSKADSDKVLRVGFEGMTVPTNWTQSDDSHGAIQITDSKDYLCGFEIDLMKRVCEEAGYTLEPYKFEWDGLLMAVQSGKIDCAISMIGPSDERKTKMDFTEPYYYADTVPVVRKDSPYAQATSLQDLQGCKATSMLNTMWYSEQIDQIPNVDKQPAMENVPVLIVAVQSGKVDTILLDRPTAEATVMANDDLTIVELEEGQDFQIDEEDISVAIAVEKGNTELVETLNAALEKISDEEKDAMLEAACENQPLSQQ